MTINPKIRLSPCARIKNSLATCIKYQEAATTTSWEEDFCRTTQVHSQCIVKEITCKKEVCLSSKINAFLHSHKDQHKADAPKRIKGFKFDRIPSSQCPNISSTLQVQEVPKLHKLQPSLDERTDNKKKDVVSFHSHDRSNTTGYLVSSFWSNYLFLE